MKKIIFVFLFWILFGLNANAQSTFEKTYGGTSYDEALACQQTLDGGYIIAGITESFGAISKDIYLVKTDSNGFTLWTKNYGNISEDVAYAVQQTADGGFVIAGKTTNSTGYPQACLIKTDSIGDTLWTKIYGNTNGSVAGDVHQTTDGGYIIIGSDYSLISGNNIYLIKTNTEGDTLWTKSFGGIEYDVAYSGEQTTDGGYIITGYTDSFGAGTDDIYLIKTDSIGDTLWTKTYGNQFNDRAYKVRQTTDSGFIIAGIWQGGLYPILIKTNSIGDTLWTKTYPFQELNDIVQTSDSGYVFVGGKITGTGNYDITLVKTDANGNVIFGRIFSSIYMDDIGFSVHQTVDGGYIISGKSETFMGGSIDFCLIKTDSNGNTDDSLCYQIITDISSSSPNIYVGGTLTNVSNTNTVVGYADIIFSSESVNANNICMGSVGINEIKIGNNSIILYPNPATNEIKISNLSTEENQIKIFNLLGQQLKNISVSNEQNHTINISDLPSGIYMLTVSNNKKISCKKFVKE